MLLSVLPLQLLSGFITPSLDYCPSPAFLILTLLALFILSSAKGHLSTLHLPGWSFSAPTLHTYSTRFPRYILGPSSWPVTPVFSPACSPSSIGEGQENRKFPDQTYIVHPLVRHLHRDEGLEDCCPFRGRNVCLKGNRRSQ